MKLGVPQIWFGETGSAKRGPKLLEEGPTLGANCDDPRGCAGACLALGVTAARWWSEVGRHPIFLGLESGN